MIGQTSFPIFPKILDKGHVVDLWIPLAKSATNDERAGEIHCVVQFVKKGDSIRTRPSAEPKDKLYVRVIEAKDLRSVQLIGKQVRLFFFFF